MTIGSALNFIDRGIHDTTLRRRLKKASDAAECEKILSEEKLMFSANEFGEAYHHRLTQCREEQEAERIREFKTWWDLLADSFTPGACGDTCSSCC